LSTVAARVQVQKEVALWRNNYEKMTKNFETMRQVAEAWEGKYNAVRASAVDPSNVSTQDGGLPTDMLGVVSCIQDGSQACVQAQVQFEGGADEMEKVVEGDRMQQLMSAAGEIETAKQSIFKKDCMYKERDSISLYQCNSRQPSGVPSG